MILNHLLNLKEKPFRKYDTLVRISVLTKSAVKRNLFKTNQVHFPRLCVFSLCVTQQLPSLSAGIFWPNKMRHQNGGQIHLCRRHFTFFLLFKGTAPICFIIMLCSYPLFFTLSLLLSTLPATRPPHPSKIIIIGASCISPNTST